jgi:hydroxymethylpyrimidine pyrophosphatase-like HAD family hydrolase
VPSTSSPWPSVKPVNACEVSFLSFPALFEADKDTEARVLFENLQPLQLAVTQSMPFCLQLIPPSNDKGTALLAVVEHLNATRPPSARPITLDGVVAFGDGENDVPMFALAGMSVAMGNGMQAAKDRARWTTHTNDEGGVGTFLDRVFFPTDVEKAGL